MDKVSKKRLKEQYVVEQMIRLYCKGNHHSEDLCPECKELLEYAKLRSKKCPFMEEKTFCSNCKIHCYKADKRCQIRKVMRYSGPRMIIYHPYLALWHLISSKKEKRRLNNDKNKTN